MGFFELDTEVAEATRKAWEEEWKKVEAARKAWEEEEKKRTPGKE